MIWRVVWACAAVVSIVAIAHYTSLYEIEQAKQDAFMMKVCTDAGGDWLRQWNNLPYCKRRDKP